MLARTCAQGTTHTKHIRAHMRKVGPQGNGKTLLSAKQCFETPMSPCYDDNVGGSTVVHSRHHLDYIHLWAITQVHSYFGEQLQRRVDACVLTRPCKYKVAGLQLSEAMFH